jgi:hypothetical protein
MRKKLFILNKLVRSRITARQKQLAERLSSYDARLTKKRRTLILMFFCFSYGVGSVHLAVSGLTSKISSTGFSKSITPMDLTIPFHIGQHVQPHAAVIDSATFNRVKHFRLYLDSLKINDPVRYMEIMSTRPHLMDSIMEFEKIYLTQ